MSETIALLVGGTKVLERELQNHLPMPLVSVATIEEAAKILGERPTRVIVLGPTLRRALATVTTLRREGQTDPRLMVVYRDDQRDEVKRHQKGRQVADSYIAQSRIQREVGPALALMLGNSSETSLEEISADALTSEEIAAEDVPPPVNTAELEPLDGATLSPPALDGDQRAQTLEGDILEFLDEFPMEEDDLLEELEDGELTLEDLPLEELPLEELTLEELPLDDLPLADLSVALEPTLAGGEHPQASGEHDLLSSELLEDMSDSLEDMELEELSLETAELVSADADSDGVLSADLDSLEAVEEVVTADLIEEVSANTERFEELETVELMEDLEDSQEDMPATEANLPATAAAVQDGLTLAQPAELMEEISLDDAVEEELAPAAPIEVAPLPPMAHAHVAVHQEIAAVEPAVQQPSAPEPVMAQPVVSEQVVPVSSVSRRQPSGAQVMFNELTSFMERLQDAASANARLEAENEQLREALELAKRAGRPELEAEVSTLRQSVGDLQLRLIGAEQARDAAVEARMRAEQSQGNHADELTRLRAELAAAAQELAAARQESAVRSEQEQTLRHESSSARSELAAAQAQLSNLESQLDARRRISADSAKSLRAIALMLEE
jgi:hypothetical protein